MTRVLGRTPGGIPAAALAVSLFFAASVSAWAQDAPASPPPPEAEGLPPEEVLPASVPAAPLQAVSNPRSKPPLTLVERLRVYGGRIGGEVRGRARELPQDVRKLRGRVQEKMGESVEGLAQEVPFPGAPPPKERPKGWAREFFLELPPEDEQIESAEGFGLIPQLGYAEETGFIYGLSLAWGGLVEKRDNWQVSIEHSTKNQLVGKLDVVSPESLDGRVRLEFNLSGRRANASYFGEGNQTLESSEDIFDFDAYDVGAGIWPRFFRVFRVGGLFRVSDYSPKRGTYDPSGPFFLPAPPVGASGGRAVLLGVGAAFDDRDNEFFPSEGYLVEIRASRTSEDLEADFEYTSVTYDARGFFRLGSPAYVLGLRGLLLTTARGDVPFFWEPALGGSSISRGIFQGRFRDRNALVLQSELRIQIHGRIGCALYFDAGQVAHRVRRIGITRFKPSGGGAVTYIVPPGRVLVVRLELAGSEEGPTFFLNLGHPF